MQLRRHVKIDSRTGRHYRYPYPLYHRVDKRWVTARLQRTSDARCVLRLLESAFTVKTADIDLRPSLRRRLILLSLRHAVLLRALLARGFVDPNHQLTGRRHRRTESLLHAAVRRCDQPLVQVLISHGASSNSRDSDSNTPLHVAAHNSDPAVTAILLSLGGANPDARDALGDTPLHVASRQGNLQLVTTLLRHGADPAIAHRRHGDYPVHVAAAGGHALGVEALCRADPTSAEARSSKGGCRPLHLAAAGGHIETVRILLGESIGVDATATDDEGNTALHSALLKPYHKGSLRDPDCYYAVVVELLKKGAPTNKHNVNGKSPLTLAAENHFSRIAQLLVANGAKVKSTAVNLPLTSSEYRITSSSSTAFTSEVQTLSPTLEAKQDHRLPGWVNNERKVDVTETMKTSSSRSTSAPLTNWLNFDGSLKFEEETSKKGQKFSSVSPKKNTVEASANYRRNRPASRPSVENEISTFSVVTRVGGERMTILLDQKHTPNNEDRVRSRRSIEGEMNKIPNIEPLNSLPVYDKKLQLVAVDIDITDEETNDQPRNIAEKKHGKSKGSSRRVRPQSDGSRLTENGTNYVTVLEKISNDKKLSEYSKRLEEAVERSADVHDDTLYDQNLTSAWSESEHTLRQDVVSPVALHDLRRHSAPPFRLGLQQSPFGFTSEFEYGRQRTRLRVTGVVPKAYNRSQKDAARRAFFSARPVGIERVSVGDPDNLDDVSLFSLASMPEIGYVAWERSMQRRQQWSEPLEPVYSKPLEDQPRQLGTSLSSLKSQSVDDINSRKGEGKPLIGPYAAPYRSVGPIVVQTDAIEEAMRDDRSSLEADDQEWDDDDLPEPHWDLAENQMPPQILDRQEAVQELLSRSALADSPAETVGSSSQSHRDTRKESSQDSVQIQTDNEDHVYTDKFIDNNGTPTSSKEHEMKTSVRNSVKKEGVTLSNVIVSGAVFTSGQLAPKVQKLTVENLVSAVSDDSSTSSDEDYQSEDEIPEFRCTPVHSVNKSQQVKSSPVKEIFRSTTLTKIEEYRPDEEARNAMKFIESDTSDASGNNSVTDLSDEELEKYEIEPGVRRSSLKANLKSNEETSDDKAEANVDSKQMPINKVPVKLQSFARDTLLQGNGVSNGHEEQLKLFDKSKPFKYGSSLTQNRDKTMIDKVSVATIKSSARKPDAGFSDDLAYARTFLPVMQTEIWQEAMKGQPLASSETVYEQKMLVPTNQRSEKHRKTITVREMKNRRPNDIDVDLPNDVTNWPRLSSIKTGVASWDGDLETLPLDTCESEVEIARVEEDFLCRETAPYPVNKSGDTTLFASKNNIKRTQKSSAVDANRVEHLPIESLMTGVKSATGRKLMETSVDDDFEGLSLNLRGNLEEGRQLPASSKSYEQQISMHTQRRSISPEMMLHCDLKQELNERAPIIKRAQAPQVTTATTWPINQTSKADAELARESTVLPLAHSISMTESRQRHHVKETCIDDDIEKPTCNLQRDFKTTEIYKSPNDHLSQDQQTVMKKRSEHEEEASTGGSALEVKVVSMNTSWVRQSENMPHLGRDKKLLHCVNVSQAMESLIDDVVPLSVFRDKDVEEKNTLPTQTNVSIEGKSGTLICIEKSSAVDKLWDNLSKAVKYDNKISSNVEGLGGELRESYETETETLVNQNIQHDLTSSPQPEKLIAFEKIPLQALENMSEINRRKIIKQKPSRPKLPKDVKEDNRNEVEKLREAFQKVDKECFETIERHNQGSNHSESTRNSGINQNNKIAIEQLRVGKISDNPECDEVAISEDKIQKQMLGVKVEDMETGCSRPVTKLILAEDTLIKPRVLNQNVMVSNNSSEVSSSLSVSNIVPSNLAENVSSKCEISTSGSEVSGKSRRPRSKADVNSSNTVHAEMQFPNSPDDMHKIEDVELIGEPRSENAAKEHQLLIANEATKEKSSETILRTGLNNVNDKTDPCSEQHKKRGSKKKHSTDWNKSDEMHDGDIGLGVPGVLLHKDNGRVKRLSKRTPLSENLFSQISTAEKQVQDSNTTNFTSEQTSDSYVQLSNNLMECNDDQTLLTLSKNGRVRKLKRPLTNKPQQQLQSSIFFVQPLDQHKTVGNTSQNSNLDGTLADFDKKKFGSFVEQRWDELQQKNSQPKVTEKNITTEILAGKYNEVSQESLSIGMSVKEGLFRIASLNDNNDKQKDVATKGHQVELTGSNRPKRHEMLSDSTAEQVDYHSKPDPVSDQLERSSRVAFDADRNISGRSSSDESASDSSHSDSSIDDKVPFKSIPPTTQVDLSKGKNRQIFIQSKTKNKGKRADEVVSPRVINDEHFHKIHETNSDDEVELVNTPMKPSGDLVLCDAEVSEGVSSIKQSPKSEHSLKVDDEHLEVTAVVRRSDRKDKRKSRRSSTSDKRTSNSFIAIVPADEDARTLNIENDDEESSSVPFEVNVPVLQPVYMGEEDQRMYQEEVEFRVFDDTSDLQFSQHRMKCEPIKKTSVFESVVGMKNGDKDANKENGRTNRPNMFKASDQVEVIGENEDNRQELSDNFKPAVEPVFLLRREPPNQLNNNVAVKNDKRQLKGRTAATELQDVLESEEAFAPLIVMNTNVVRQKRLETRPDTTAKPVDNHSKPDPVSDRLERNSRVALDTDRNISARSSSDESASDSSHSDSFSEDEVPFKSRPPTTQIDLSKEQNRQILIQSETKNKGERVDEVMSPRVINDEIYETNSDDEVELVKSSGDLVLRNAEVFEGVSSMKQSPAQITKPEHSLKVDDENVEVTAVVRKSDRKDKRKSRRSSTSDKRTSNSFIAIVPADEDARTLNIENDDEESSSVPFEVNVPVLQPVYMGEEDQRMYQEEVEFRVFDDTSDLQFSQHRKKCEPIKKTSVFESVIGMKNGDKDANKENGRTNRPNIFKASDQAEEIGENEDNRRESSDNFKPDDEPVFLLRREPPNQLNNIVAGKIDKRQLKGRTAATELQDVLESEEAFAPLIVMNTNVVRQKRLETRPDLTAIPVDYHSKPDPVSDRLERNSRVALDADRKISRKSRSDESASDSSDSDSDSFSEDEVPFKSRPPKTQIDLSKDQNHQNLMRSNTKNKGKRVEEVVASRVINDEIYETNIDDEVELMNTSMKPSGDLVLRNAEVSEGVSSIEQSPKSEHGLKVDDEHLEVTAVVRRSDRKDKRKSRRSSTSDKRTSNSFIAIVPADEDARTLNIENDDEESSSVPFEVNVPVLQPVYMGEEDQRMYQEEVEFRVFDDTSDLQFSQHRMKCEPIKKTSVFESVVGMKNGDKDANKENGRTNRPNMFKASDQVEVIGENEDNRQELSDNFKPAVEPVFLLRREPPNQLNNNVAGKNDKRQLKGRTAATELQDVLESEEAFAPLIVMNTNVVCQKRLETRPDTTENPVDNHSKPDPVSDRLERNSRVALDTDRNIFARSSSDESASDSSHSDSFSEDEVPFTSRPPTTQIDLSKEQNRQMLIHSETKNKGKRVDEVMSPRVINDEIYETNSDDEVELVKSSGDLVLRNAEVFEGVSSMKQSPAQITKPEHSLKVDDENVEVTAVVRRSDRKDKRKSRRSSTSDKRTSNSFIAIVPADEDARTLNIENDDEESSSVPFEVNVPVLQPVYMGEEDQEICHEEENSRELDYTADKQFNQQIKKYELRDKKPVFKSIVRTKHGDQDASDDTSSDSGSSIDEHLTKRLQKVKTSLEKQALKTGPLQTGTVRQQDIVMKKKIDEEVLTPLGDVELGLCVPETNLDDEDEEFLVYATDERPCMLARTSVDQDKNGDFTTLLVSLKDEENVKSVSDRKRRTVSIGKRKSSSATATICKEADVETNYLYVGSDDEFCVTKPGMPKVQPIDDDDDDQELLDKEVGVGVAELKLTRDQKNRVSIGRKSRKNKVNKREVVVEEMTIEDREEQQWNEMPNVLEITSFLETKEQPSRSSPAPDLNLSNASSVSNHNTRKRRSRRMVDDDEEEIVTMTTTVTKTNNTRRSRDTTRREQTDHDLNSSAHQLRSHSSDGLLKQVSPNIIKVARRRHLRQPRARSVTTGDLYSHYVIGYERADVTLKPLTVDAPKQSLQQAAMESLTSGFLGDQRPRLRKQPDPDERPLVYTRGVYRPQPVYWKTKQEVLVPTGVVPAVSSFINEDTTERELSVETASKVSRNQSSLVRSDDNRSSAFVPVRPSSQLATQASRNSYRLRSVRRGGYVTAPAQREDPRLMSNDPIVTEPGPFDFQDYGLVARMWMEHVDVKTVHKSKTMYLSVMPRGSRLPDQIMRALKHQPPLSDELDGVMPPQWVIVRSRTLQRKRQKLLERRMLSSLGVDLDQSRPLSPVGFHNVLFFQIGSWWKNLAWTLFEGIQTEPEIVRMIADIELKSPDSIEDQVRDLMSRWWKRRGPEATVEQLRECLDLIGVTYVQEDFPERNKNAFSFDSEHEERDVGQVADTDPSVSRLMRTYKVQSMNASFGPDTMRTRGGVDLDASTSGPLSANVTMPSSHVSKLFSSSFSSSPPSRSAKPLSSSTMINKEGRLTPSGTSKPHSKNIIKRMFSSAENLLKAENAEEEPPANQDSVKLKASDFRHESNL